MTSFLGWTLIHSLWQGGVIVVAVAMALWLTRRGAASTRYGIAVVGLALTVAAPVATTVATARSGADRMTAAIRVAPAPLVPRAVAEPRNSVGTHRSDLTRSRFSLVTFAGEHVDAALPWLVAVWLLGVSLLSIRVLAGVANVRRIARRGVSVADARVRSMAELVAGRLGIRSAIRVLQSTHVDVPMVVGWLKPAVLVPVSLLAGTSPAHLDAIDHLEMLLAHELAHIRRYDTIVNLGQTIVETLLFYHPAVWWMSARVREEREHCCDDLAIGASGGDRAAYGAMLLRLEESRSTLVLAAAATDGSLVRRVRRIVLGAPAGVDLGVTWLAGVSTMLLVLLVAASRAPVAAARAAESVPVIPARSSVAEQTPASAPASQQPSPKPTMLRSSRTLLAGAAALALSAAPAPAPAQSLPNVSGHWVRVGESEDSLLTLEQSRQMLTIVQGEARVSFRIGGTDGPGVLMATGPVAVGLNVRGVELSLDATAASLLFRARWDGGHVVDAEMPVSGEKIFATMRLSLDRDGNLVVQVDTPSDGDQPAKRSVQRYRRA